MEDNIIIIQKIFRGYFIRSRRLPFILYHIQKYLQSMNIQFSSQNDDGRINSCTDEDTIIKLLVEKYNEKIKKPKSRMWYDILVYDHMYGWLPINIKTTNTYSSDNTGNFAMCVYAYTDENLCLDIDKSYENGKMSMLFLEKIKNKKYNYSQKKDYYFLVLNKNNCKDVIINSVKGLTKLTPNANNLPFQICWDKTAYLLMIP